MSSHRLACTTMWILISFHSRVFGFMGHLITPARGAISGRHLQERHQLHPAYHPVSVARRHSTAMLAKGFGADKSKPTSKRGEDKKVIKSNKTPTATAPCPCFSGNPYGECCKPFHDGETSPQPVQVMRARYAAYACNMPQFIMKSTHPDHEDYGKPGWRDDILVFCNNYKFTGLEVGQPEEDQDDPGKIFVYFTAMMASAKGDGAVSFDERSLFLRDDEGEWKYKAPDANYKESVNVISKRKYSAASKTDKPSGFSAR